MLSKRQWPVSDCVNYTVNSTQGATVSAAKELAQVSPKMNASASEK